MKLYSGGVVEGSIVLLVLDDLGRGAGRSARSNLNPPSRPPTFPPSYPTRYVQITKNQPPTMPTHRGSILTAGLGRFAATDANAQAHFGPDAGKKARELLATSVEKAKNAGFDVVTIDVCPSISEHTS